MSVLDLILFLMKWGFSVFDAQMFIIMNPLGGFFSLMYMTYSFLIVLASFV